MLLLRYETNIDDRWDSEVISKNMCTRWWYSLEWGWAEGTKGEWEGFVLIRSLFSFRQQKLKLSGMGDDWRDVGDYGPRPGKVRKAWSWVHWGSRTVFLSLPLICASSTFWLHSSVQTSLGPHTAADGSKASLSYSSHQQTPHTPVTLSSKFQRRAGVGPDWVWGVKKCLLPSAYRDWSGQVYVRVEGDAAPQQTKESHPLHFQRICRKVQWAFRKKD